MAAAAGWVDVLTQERWTVSYDDGTTRLTRADGQGQLHTLYASATRTWLCLARPVEGEPPLGLDLLRRNARMFMAKYALDERDRLVLAGEVPLVPLEPGAVRRLVDALVTYGQPGEAAGAARPTARQREVATTALGEQELRLFLHTVAAMGWSGPKTAGPNSWELRYKGDRGHSSAYLTAGPAWAYLQVPLLHDGLSATDGETRPHVMPSEAEARQLYTHYLLHLNDALYMAKIGLDEEDRAILSLELPTDVLTADLFRLAARTVARYLDDYTQEVQIMAALDGDGRLRRWLASRAERTAHADMRR
jgi:hypothetical protein